jgi:hypothetical protein
MEMVEDQVSKLKHYIRYCGLTYADIIFELKLVIFENNMDDEFDEDDLDGEGAIISDVPVKGVVERPSSAD